MDCGSIPACHSCTEVQGAPRCQPRQMGQWLPSQCQHRRQWCRKPGARFNWKCKSLNLTLKMRSAQQSIKLPSKKSLDGSTWQFWGNVFGSGCNLTKNHQRKLKSTLAILKELSVFKLSRFRFPSTMHSNWTRFGYFLPQAFGLMAQPPIYGVVIKFRIGPLVVNFHISFYSLMFSLAEMFRPVSIIHPLSNNLSIRPNTIEFIILPRAGFKIDHEGAKMELGYCSIK